MTATQTTITGVPIPEPPPLTEKELQEIIWQCSLEPRPVYRCLTCGWEIETNDLSDLQSSESFRAEIHARETGHDMGFFVDTDDVEPEVRMRP